jgi:hypothetical protein
MSKILLSIAFVLLFVGCSKDYSKLTFLDKYSEPQTHSLLKNQHTSIRLPANDSEKLCFVDNYDISRIKSEIESLEKTFERSVRVPSKFRFTEFKNAETHYLSKYSEMMYFSEESKSCDSLPCLLNIPYGDKDGEEGYRVYHWFLKMGIGISTLDQIPDFKRDAGRAVSEYLFPNEELKLMNMTSDILSSKYKNILVSTLHRFPDGTSPGVLVAGQYSYYPTNKSRAGTIFLTQQRISYNKENQLISGHYIHTLIHELSHALDFTFGEDSKDKSHYSLSDNWINLSWKWGESKVTKTQIVDGIEQEFEEIVMDWIVDEKKAETEGFVRGYQRSSHKEDFADSGANFVVSSSAMKRVSPKKLDVFKDHFYGAQTFLADDEKSYVTSTLTHNYREAFWNILKDCTLSESTVQHHSSFKYPASFSLLKSSERSCMKDSIENYFNIKFIEHNKKRYKGCYTTKGKKQEFIQSAINDQSELMDELIDEIGGLDGLKEQWAIFRKELEATCDVKSIYLQARKLESKKEIYSEELEMCANDVLSKSTYSHDIFLQEVQTYITNNTFDIAKEEAESSFRKMVKGLSSTFSPHAKNIIESCSVYRGQESEMLVSPISGGKVFVNSYVLNCINEGFQDNYDSVLREYLQGKYALSQLGLGYISELYMNQYVESFNIEFEKLNIMEIKGFKQELFENASLIFKAELSDKKSQIEYFRSKSTSRFKEKLSSRLESYIEANNSILVTLSLNELSNELVLALTKELSSYSLQSASGEKGEVDLFVATYKKDYSLSLKSEIKWKSINFIDFSRACTDEASKYLKGFKYKNTLDFYSEDLVLEKLITSSCSILDVEYYEELSAFRKEVNELEEESRKYLKDDYSWRINLSKSDSEKSCKAYLTGMYTEMFNKYHYLSESTSEQRTQNTLCSESLNNWRFEVAKVEESIRCNCNVSQPDNSLYSPSAWKEYVASYKKYLNLELFSKIDTLINKEIESCKTKFSRTRYSVIKIKRKKCLLSIDESLFSYSGDIAKDTYSAKVRSKLKRLNDSIEEHLK